MKKERRWLKSVLAAAAEPHMALPWARQTRRRPKTLTSVVQGAKSKRFAAH